MTTTNVYLSFTGNCLEAMSFYKSCLGGTLNTMSIGASPMSDQFPPAMKDHILHATLEHEGISLMGSDMGTPGIAPNSAISISLNTDNMTEMKRLFNVLGQGGKEVRPIHQFFMGSLAAVEDKFGISWLLYCNEQS